MSAGDEIFTGNDNNKKKMCDCVFSVFVSVLVFAISINTIFFWFFGEINGSK